MQPLLVDVLVHRQQVHGRHAEPLQVCDCRVAGQARVGATLCGWNIRVQLREPLDVHLIEHGVFERGVQMCIGAPGMARVDNARLEGERRVVTRVQVSGVARVAAELLVAPLEGADDLARIRVEQQLVRVEAVATVRAPLAMRAVAVHQPRCAALEVAMPDVVRVAGQGSA